jgi:hypothetical protein
MPRFLLLLTMLFLLLPLAAFAQGKPSTPKPGSKERKAIMDTLRVPVEKDLKKKVVFKVDTLNVLGEWAFLRGVPQQPDGKPMNYKGTVYQQALEDGAFDDGISALLRKVKGKWKVITYVIGATDVTWATWHEDYKAPRAILGLPDY